MKGFHRWYKCQDCGFGKESLHRRLKVCPDCRGKMRLMNENPYNGTSVKEHAQ